MTTTTTTSKTTPTATPLPASLQRIIDVCTRKGVRNAADAAQTLRSANVGAEDLLPWADFDHPIRDGYGRQAVHLGDDFELMIMSWNPGDFSAIHDHGNTQWGAVMYFGVAEHATYAFDGTMLRTLDRTMTRTGDVNLVDHDLIHQMGNPTQQRMMSLHLYGCAEPTEGVTGDARIFDLLNGEIQYTDGGVFHCLPETKINRRDGLVLADRGTTLEHHHQMLDRVYRVKATGEGYDPELDFVANRLINSMYRLDARSELAA